MNIHSLVREPLTSKFKVKMFNPYRILITNSMDLTMLIMIL